MRLPLDDARAVLRAQPFSTWIGAQLLAFDSDGATLALPITDQLKQQFGFVHGGVIAYLADNALTFAGGAVLGPAVVTSEFKINYLRPAIGERLVARATVVHVGRNQAVCQCEIEVIHGMQRLFCAVAQGTIARVGSASAEGPGQMDEDGPAIAADPAGAATPIAAASDLPADGR